MNLHLFAYSDYESANRRFGRGASASGLETLLPKWLTAATDTESFKRVSYLIRDLSGSLLWKEEEEEEEDPANYTLPMSDSDLAAAARMIGISASDLRVALTLKHYEHYRLTTLCHFHGIWLFSDWIRLHASQ